MVKNTHIQCHGCRSCPLAGWFLTSQIILIILYLKSDFGQSDQEISFAMNIQMFQMPRAIMECWRLLKIRHLCLCNGYCLLYIICRFKQAIQERLSCFNTILHDEHWHVEEEKEKGLSTEQDMHEVISTELISRQCSELPL